MGKYISKDALLAEVERKKDICQKVVLDLRTQENKGYYLGKAEAYSEMIELANTLDVKACVYEAIYKCNDTPYKERKFFSTLEYAEEYTKDFKDVEIIEHRVF